MNSAQASFLDRPGDGTFLVTWLDTRLTRKEFSPATAYSVAALGYDGAVRWQKRLDFSNQISGMPRAHWAGELRVAFDGLAGREGDVGGVFRLSSEGEPFDSRTLSERRSVVRGLVPTPTGYASLAQWVDATGRGGSELTIATCERAR